MTLQRKYESVHTICHTSFYVFYHVFDTLPAQKDGESKKSLLCIEQKTIINIRSSSTEQEIGKYRQEEVSVRSIFASYILIVTSLTLFFVAVVFYFVT